jgi:hypothetical protein
MALENQRAERENDAERTVEARTDRQAMYFAGSVVVLLLVVFMVLLFAGHADLAINVVKYLVFVVPGV